jgi:hypothetical protein
MPIYMTGTHEEEWASKGVPNSVLCAKPFAPAQLVNGTFQFVQYRSSTDCADEVRPSMVALLI